MFVFSFCLLVVVFSNSSDLLYAHVHNPCFYPLAWVVFIVKKGLEIKKLKQQPNKQTLPNLVKAGYLNIPVVPDMLNPLRCFKCQKFGHSTLTCAGCGQFDHDSKTCQNDMACVNCKGHHFGFS